MILEVVNLIMGLNINFDIISTCLFQNYITKIYKVYLRIINSQETAIYFLRKIKIKFIFKLKLFVFIMSKTLKIHFY